MQPAPTQPHDRIERALIIRRDILLRECAELQDHYDHITDYLMRQYSEVLDELLYMSRVLNTYRSSPPDAPSRMEGRVMETTNGHHSPAGKGFKLKTSRARA